MYFSNVHFEFAILICEAVYCGMCMNNFYSVIKRKSIKDLFTCDFFYKVVTKK